jgi:MFS family permease
VTQFAAFLILLDVSIVNVALPSMEQALGVAAARVQWVVSGYALTLALVPAGPVTRSAGGACS